MALGGGVYIAQNKTLPGSYINFVSASRASAVISDRGIAALPLELDWGKDGEIIEVTAEQFVSDSLNIFGYAYDADKLKGIRDLFKNIRKGYFYKLNTAGAKATCTYATALYTGVRGNDITIVIAENEAYTAENPLYDVTTLFAGSAVDEQTVETMSELINNDYVTFKSGATITVTAGTALTTGTNGSVIDGTYQTFLDKIESYSVNSIGCLSTNDTIKALFSNFTKRMRDEVGVKMQCVLYKYTAADHEGVVSINNDLVGKTTDPSLVYWTLGVIGGCAINKSNTNKLYDGEFDVNVDFTQTALEAAINAGKFMFHRVDDTVRVLMDVNTLITTTDKKSSDFKDNQTIRILDQVGNDIASMFNTKYLGQIPNNASGRVSLWNDIVKHHQDMEAIGAIEGFDSSSVVIEQGGTKKSVVVQDTVTPVNAMAKLYMTILVQ